MGGDLVELAIWVFILAAVGFFTWVRKLIEKAQKGDRAEPGQKGGVGGAVRTQIEKYMKALDESPMGRGIAAPPRVEPEPRPEQPAPRSPQAAPARLVRPEPVPSVGAAQEVGRPRRLKATAAALVSRTGGRGFRRQLDRKTVRDAVILAELLGPPVAERQDFRLF